jgi:hypothetical protein
MSRPSLTPNLTRIYFYYADLLRIVWNFLLNLQGLMICG